MFLIGIITFLVFSAILIIHELGHFIFAKRAGIFVEEFGLGYAPRVLGIQKYPGIFKFKFFLFNNKPIDEELKFATIYSLNAIPFGAFVKIFGESHQQKENPLSYISKSWFNRFLVIFGSIIAHFIIAIVALSVAFSIGLPTVVSDNEDFTKLKEPKIQIVEVAKNSPAEKMGIKIGDIILTLSNEEILRPQKIVDIQNFINNHRGEEIKIEIQRGINKIILTGEVRKEAPQNEGLLGIAMAKTAIVSYSAPKAIYEGFVNSFKIFGMMAVFLANALWGLIKGSKPVGVELTGPVGILNLTANIAGLGINYIFNFFAILNLNIALFNLLPIPALDGGRLAFLIIEKIIGRPIKEKTEQAIHSLGFAILLFIMVLVTYRDIIRLF